MTDSHQQPLAGSEGGRSIDRVRSTSTSHGAGTPLSTVMELPIQSTSPAFPAARMRSGAMANLTASPESGVWSPGEPGTHSTVYPKHERQHSTGPDPASLQRAAIRIVPPFRSDVGALSHRISSHRIASPISQGPFGRPASRQQHSDSSHWIVIIVHIGTGAVEGTVSLMCVPGCCRVGDVGQALQCKQLLKLAGADGVLSSVQYGEVMTWKERGGRPLPYRDQLHVIR